MLRNWWIHRHNSPPIVELIGVSVVVIRASHPSVDPPKYEVWWIYKGREVFLDEFARYIDAERYVVELLPYL